MVPKRKKVWLMAVDMGYGHQRAAYPLLPIAEGGEIITANNYPGIPESDRKTWGGSENSYNLISRFKGFPLLGRPAFAIFDTFQEVKDFYPAKDESAPTIQLKLLYSNIKKGLGRHLIEKLMVAEPLPIVGTHFAVGHIAEFWNYPGDIYTVVTDSDISRAWAPLEPEISKIKYFASSPMSAARLLRYGVKKENIIETGFPLPFELLGPKLKFAKDNLRSRISRLDPKKRYWDNFAPLELKYLGKAVAGAKRARPTLSFCIGGAGAQQEIGESLVYSLAPLIKKGQISLNIVVGVSSETREHFVKFAERSGLGDELGEDLKIIFMKTKDEYFKGFSEVLRTTDALWTKPSELTFYAALGIPIIIAPPVGSHEVRNREWLLDLGAGVDSRPAGCANEWLPKMIEDGHLAEAAMNGFIKMEKWGAENIMEYFQKHK